MPYKDPEEKKAHDRDRIRRLSTAAKAVDDPTKALRDRNRELERQLAVAEHELAERRREEREREALLRVVSEVEVPRWLDRGSAPKKGPGVPTLNLSDWHTGEVVVPKRVGGKNRYDRGVQRERVRQLVKGVVDLTKHHMVLPDYPGIVVPVNGDMVSGDIHDELTVTNWGDVRDVLKEGTALVSFVLERLADEFPQVFVPWTTGNHGRMTKKMQHKRRVSTSYDAILGDMVAERLASKSNVRFAIAEGARVLYSVYGHRYLLTHGDPASTGAKGGDGIIGAAGPIVRGLMKLLAQASQVGMEFDTLILGHFHARFLMDDVMVNGSLKGFDELALNSGYRYAPPSQNLWFTHPERGPTAYWPVYVEPKGKKYEGNWMSLYEE